MSVVNGITNGAHAIADPVGFILQAVVGLLGHLVSVARVDLGGVLDRFLFRTVDPTVAGNRPITANPNLVSLNLGLAVAVDAMIGLVILLTSLRSIFERSMRSKYDLKVILPRVLLAIVLAHGSLLFMQMAIDLNNALDSVALSLGGPLNGDTLPWSPSLSPETIARLVSGQDLFQALLMVALVVAMAILVLAYVIRTALLNVLIVTAPLAALLSVMPGHAQPCAHVAAPLPRHCVHAGGAADHPARRGDHRVRLQRRPDHHRVRPGDAVAPAQGARRHEHLDSPREQGAHHAAHARAIGEARADAGPPPRCTAQTA